MNSYFCKAFILLSVNTM